MEQKEYEIAYGNTFTRVFSVLFHLIVEATCLLLVNIPAVAFISFILIVVDNSLTKYVFLVLLTALAVFDITDLIMVIFKKPQVILTGSYLYLKGGFTGFGTYREKVILYNEILSCERSWNSYIRKYGTWDKYFILCFYDRNHEVTIKTNKRILWSNWEYIIPIVNNEEFMDDLNERIESAQQLEKKK